MRVKIEIYSKENKLIEQTVFDNMEVNDAFQIGDNLVNQKDIVYNKTIIPLKDARMELEIDKDDSRVLCILIRYGAKL